jgi:hypothetical protein
MAVKYQYRDNAGIKPKLDFSEASPAEQKIIRKLGKVFNIGFFRHNIFKEVYYSYIFAKPTDEFILKFNIENEILVLFNKLDIFESRTLDYVDKLMTDFFNRLDKLCIVIISNDKDICKKIETLNSKESMSRIIVPFNYDELLQESQDQIFIENRFKQFFYARDLFDYDSPIKSESFFFGRTQIVQRFVDKLTYSENCALFGLRKIGKTSVLYAVRRLCNQNEYPVIYIDCQSPSLHRKRWYEALQYIIGLGADQNRHISKSNFNNFEYGEKTAATLFEKDLQILQEKKSNRQIILIFDEIENITFDTSPTVHWSTGEDYLLFWQTIRSIFQSNRELFSFIIAGVNPIVLEESTIGKYDNPIYNIATPIYLDLFNLETVKEMVAKIGTYMGLSFEDEVYTLLKNDFGGHPFLTRIACSNINKLLSEKRPTKITQYWYQNNREIFAETVVNYVNQLLSVLKNYYEQEYEMLEVLASGNIRKFGEFVMSTPNAASHLSGYGLVNITKQEYYFRLKIVEDYLKSRINIQRLFNTKEERWQEVSRRRNAMEVRMRNLAIVLLKAAYYSNAKDKILNALPSERRVKVNHLDIDEIFKDHFNFSDLLQLYVKEFKHFENIFERQDKQFYNYMDHINRYRIDAHAKDIDDYNFNLLMVEFDWVEECLNKAKVY